MDNTAEKIKQKVREKALSPQKETNEYLLCIATQNEELIEIQKAKLTTLTEHRDDQRKFQHAWRRFKLFSGYMLAASLTISIVTDIIDLPADTKVILDRISTKFEEIAGEL